MPCSAYTCLDVCKKSFTYLQQFSRYLGKGRVAPFFLDHPVDALDRLSVHLNIILFSIKLFRFSIAAGCGLLLQTLVIAVVLLLLLLSCVIGRFAARGRRRHHRVKVCRSLTSVQCRACYHWSCRSLNQCISCPEAPCSFQVN